MGMTGENQNKGFDHFIKEKANYDRIRMDCANKEKKLNKVCIYLFIVALVEGSVERAAHLEWVV
jgi:hypothetical protein